MIEFITALTINLSTYLALLSVVCAALFALGTPIVLVFGLWVIGFQLQVPVFPMANISITAFEELQSFPYAAIPLFIVVGDLINEAGISSELVQFARSIVGWLPGSSGNAALVTSGIFSAITGSNAATTASVGKAMHPEMVKNNYDEKHAAATVAAGGVIGSIIPPSILLIIYGVTFNISINQLFLAGILPGIAMLTGLIGVNTYIAKKRGFDINPDFEFSIYDVLKSTWKAKIGLGSIIVLLGGIFLGYFTPSEAAAVAIVYILFFSIIYGKIHELNQISNAIFTSLRLVGALIPVVIMSVLIQQNLSYLGLQESISNAVLSLGNKWLIMFAMIVILIITGSTLSSVPNLVLTAPLLAAAATEIGLSPVVWGITFMMSDAIGFITPPYGINLYVISGITDIDYLYVAMKAIPYLAILSVISKPLLLRIF
jgi:C4-dicarboxylate transporter DctM subunit